MINLKCEKKCEKMCFKNAIFKNVKKMHFKNVKKCEKM